MRDAGGDGESPVPPVGASGTVRVSLDASLKRAPSRSNRHVRARSCSIFCCASTDPVVTARALRFALEASIESWARAPTPTLRTVTATSVSSRENPASVSMAKRKCKQKSMSDGRKNRREPAAIAHRLGNMLRERCILCTLGPCGGEQKVQATRRFKRRSEGRSGSVRRPVERYQPKCGRCETR